MTRHLVSYFNEEPHIDGAASGSKPGASFGLCSGNPGSLCRDKDSGSVADTGGSASGMDNRCLGSNATELEYLDAQSKSGRIESVAGKTKVGTTRPADTQGSGTAETTSGKNAAGFRAASSRLGRSDTGGSSETDLWDNPESSSSTVFDAPPGLSAETRRLFICTGARAGRQEVSGGTKKNSKT